MTQGILFLVLLAGSSAPLASCADTLMRKVAKKESFVMEPSGSVKQTPTTETLMRKVAKKESFVMEPSGSAKKTPTTDTLMRKVAKKESFVMEPSGSVKQNPTTNTLMRKVAKKEAYVLAPSGATAKSPTTGGNQDVPLSSYQGNIEASSADEFDEGTCQAHLRQLKQTCGQGDQLCTSESSSDLGLADDTKLAYAAVLLAGDADLAKNLAQSMFPLSQIAPTGSQDQSEPESCPQGPETGAAPCFNPKTGDPAGLCCGMAETMKGQCNGVDQACFRRHMCGHCQVSKDWKSQNNCGMQSIAMGCDETQEDLLKDRASSNAIKSKAEGSSLDEVLQDKICSVYR